MSLSKEEKIKILSKEFKIWPDPKPGNKYGPLPKQKLLFIDEMPEEKRPHLHMQDVVLFWGGARAGKCLGIDTPIIMYDGIIKKVQDIEVGDLLMGPDSKPRRVESLIRGQEEMYKIIPNKGEPWICNKSHILSLKTSGKRLFSKGKRNEKRKQFSITGLIENISLDNYLKLSKQKQSEYKLFHSETIDFNNNKKLLLDPYFLGLWLGDGSNNSADIATTDETIKSYLNNYIKTFDLQLKNVGTNNLSYRITSGQRGGFHFRSPLINNLHYYNLLKNKHIPHDFLTSSIENRLQLLAGLIDADGYLAKNGYYEIVQKNKQLTDDICFLARSLGFRAIFKKTIKAYIHKDQRREDIYYRIIISGDLSKIPVKIDYKKFKGIKSLRASHLVTGFKLESLGIGNYYGFEISGPDKLFLLGDFTVTHNSLSGMARGMHLALKYPGINIICGAKTFTDVRDLMINELKKMLSIHKEWDHPLVERYPTEHRKTLELINGSKFTFLHFEDVIRLRGREAGAIIMEEVTQLKDVLAFQEMIRRLSFTGVPILQIILLTNPPEERDWVYDTFQLKQFSPNYEGDPIPIGPACKCHLCQKCLYPSTDDIEKLGKVSEEVEYIENKCPKCGHDKEFYIIKNKFTPEGKITYCPGKQHYWRVIKTASHDNPHLPSTYIQNTMESTDKATANLYVMGVWEDIRKGFVYWAHGSHNLLQQKKEIDFNKELIWSFDFNTAFQCSVICQTEGTEDNENVYVLDEIIIPETKPNGPQYIAAEFINRIRSQPEGSTYQGPINIYGDPNGWNRLMGSSEASYYQIILNELQLAGFKLKIMVRKIPGKTMIPIITKVNSLNMMLRDMRGKVRIFINKEQCPWLIASLEGVKWKETGKHINDNCDTYAVRDPNKSQPRTLTHPADALAYFVAKKFPIIQDEIIYPFAQVPGEEIIQLTPEGIKNKLINNVEIIEKKPISLMDQLEKMGMLEDPGPLFYW